MNFKAARSHDLNIFQIRLPGAKKLKFVWRFLRICWVATVLFNDLISLNNRKMFFDLEIPRILRKFIKKVLFPVRVRVDSLKCRFLNKDSKQIREFSKWTCLPCVFLSYIWNNSSFLSRLYEISTQKLHISMKSRFLNQKNIKILSQT